MPLRDGFFSTATQTSCCNRIQRSNRVRLLVVSTHDFPDSGQQCSVLQVISGDIDGVLHRHSLLLRGVRVLVLFVLCVFTKSAVLYI